MRVFQRITVPLKLSTSDADLVRYASLVARLGVTREFHFVHVVEPDMQHHRPGGPDDALAHLESTVAAHFGSRDHEMSLRCRVLEGSPYDAVSRFVVEHRSELVLLRGPFGSGPRPELAGQLAMTGPCSVCVLPGNVPAGVSRILAPIDFSSHSADSLSHAAAIACLSDLEECLALHVSPPSTNGRHAGDRNGCERAAPARFLEFLKSVNAHSIPIIPHLVTDADAARSILEFARQNSADLIVISAPAGPHGAPLARDRLVPRILHESEVPVLVLRADHAAGLPLTGSTAESPGPSRDTPL